MLKLSDSTKLMVFYIWSNQIILCGLFVCFCAVQSGTCKKGLCSALCRSNSASDQQEKFWFEEKQEKTWMCSRCFFFWKEMMKSKGADISCCTSRAGQIQVALWEVAPSLCSGRQQLQLITPLAQLTRKWNWRNGESNTNMTFVLFLWAGNLQREWFITGKSSLKLNFERGLMGSGGGSLSDFSNILHLSSGVQICAVNMCHVQQWLSVFPF